MPVAKNIKYCRKKAGLTQQAFADAIGFSKQTVISWESKRTAVPSPSAHKVAEYFGVDFTEFCDADLELLDRITEGQEPLSLTKQETQNLLLFRQLPDHFKALVRYAILSEYERLRSDKK